MTNGPDDNRKPGNTSGLGWARRWVPAVFTAVLPLVLVGCGSVGIGIPSAPESTGGVTTPSASSLGIIPGSTSAAAGGGGGGGGGGATVQGGGANGGCDLDQVAAIAGESSGQDEQLTQGWSLLRANGWTVFVPSGDWHLTSSDAGFSAISPTGGVEADDVSWPSQTPWTESALEQKFVADVADFQVICQTSFAQSATGGSQGFEFTAVEGGAPVQGVLILSLPTSQISGFYSGQVRDLFTPTTQYSTTTAETLMLIIKRAIFEP